MHRFIQSFAAAADQTLVPRRKGAPLKYKLKFCNNVDTFSVFWCLGPFGGLKLYWEYSYRVPPPAAGSLNSENGMFSDARPTATQPRKVSDGGL